jgi:hypothetical protein
MAGVETLVSGDTRHSFYFIFIFLFKSLSSNDGQLNALQGKEQQAYEYRQWR